MNLLRRYDINPKTVDEVMDAQTPDGMRRRINRYSREDPLVKAVLDMAYHRGFSGEDTMTILAFEALRQRERLMDHALNEAMTSIPAHVIPR